MQNFTLRVRMDDHKKLQKKNTFLAPKLKEIFLKHCHYHLPEVTHYLER